MARGKIVYVVSYNDNRFDPVSNNHRVAVFNSFRKALNEAFTDVEYWCSNGGYVQDEWYNDYIIDNATCARIRVVLQGGDTLNICVTPSYVN